MTTINKKINYKFTLMHSMWTLLLAALLLISCGKSKETADDHEHEEEHLAENMVELRDDQIKLAGIEMGNIKMRTLSGTLKTNGRVTMAPQNLATVCMPMGGFVKSTLLMPGNAVRKGQTLAVLENQEFIDLQQNYLEAKNKLEYAGAEYKRHSELYKDEVYSQKSMQLANTDFRNLKAEVKALEQKLALIGINPKRLNEDNISRSVALVSPISGYVKTVNASIGKSVSATDVLFEIVNTDKLFLELTFFEKDVDKVCNGQTIHFILNNETEQHKAVIYQTAKSVNNDKTYTVYANVINPCKNMLPGMYVNATVETVNRQVTSLPDDAIVSFDDKDYIFVFDKTVKENGNLMTEYKMVQVGKGVTDAGYTEVILPDDFNVKAGKVAVKGAYNLLSAKKNAGEMSCSH